MGLIGVAGQLAQKSAASTHNRETRAMSVVGATSAIRIIAQLPQ